MRLYYDPATTTCRPILFFAAEHGLDLDLVHVDILLGEHKAAWYAAINPDQCVPVLEDGDFRLTESSAILKYLAEKLGSPAYPADLQARARANQWMDWFNTGFYRELGYGVVYPQVVPEYRHADPAMQREHLARGHAALDRRLQILEARLAAAGGPFTGGAAVTLADYLGSIFLSIGDLVRLDLSPYPAVACWMATMKARPAWDEVNAAFYGWCSAATAQAA